MTREEWQALALLYNARREEIVRRWSDVSFPAYDRQLARAFQLGALEDTVRATAKLLRRRSSRFDEMRFLTLAGLRSGYSPKKPD